MCLPSLAVASFSVRWCRMSPRLAHHLSHQRCPLVGRLRLSVQRCARWDCCARPIRICDEFTHPSLVVHDGRRYQRIPRCISPLACHLTSSPSGVRLFPWRCPSSHPGITAPFSFPCLSTFIITFSLPLVSLTWMPLSLSLVPFVQIPLLPLTFSHPLLWLAVTPSTVAQLPFILQPIVPCHLWALGLMMSSDPATPTRLVCHRAFPGIVPACHPPPPNDVEVVRGVAQRSGRPATVRGPPHVTRYILLPRAPTHPPQPPSAQQRHEGEGRGFVLRSPKDGLSAGTWRRKVVMCPRRGNDPASGHPRAHQPPLGRGTSPPAWDGRLDAPGQRRRHLPSSAWTRRREVKQGKSGGSVGTTDQGKGKGRSVVRPMGTVAYRGKGQGKGKGRGEGRLGQGGRGRSKGGEKLMGTTAYGGKGSKGRAANGDRPVGAASCRRDHHTMASCQNPHPTTSLVKGTWVIKTLPHVLPLASAAPK